jgi:hypothetical protein
LITFKYKGNFNKTTDFLKKNNKKDYVAVFEKYAREGVRVLASATPKDSGETSNSWDFEIVTRKTSTRIYWKNKNIVDGVPVVILLQYGHGTRSGAFVEGRDFINPVMRPIFDKIADSLWKEVIS